jgi:hypothetical protein
MAAFFRRRFVARRSHEIWLAPGQVLRRRDRRRSTTAIWNVGPRSTGRNFSDILNEFTSMASRFASCRQAASTFRPPVEAA